MRFFFDALVMNFMLFFNKLESSGLRKVSTVPPDNNREGIDHLVTSRRPTQSSSTHNHPTSLAHEALDLGGYYSNYPESFSQQSHGYHSTFQESSHQQNLTEIPYLVKKYKFVDGIPPEVASSSRMVQNDQIQHQSPEYSQVYPGNENIAWLIDHHRRGRLPAPIRIRRTLPANIWPLKNELTREEKRELRAQLDQLRSFGAQSQPNASSEKPPPALHEIDESITLDGHQKRKAVNVKAARKKKVLDSHDQFSQQSSVQQNPYPDFEPQLIYDPSKGFNPYLETQGQNPNQYAQTNGPNYKPNNNPNPHNNWDHHGGSGFRSP